MVHFRYNQSFTVFTLVIWLVKIKSHFKFFAFRVFTSAQGKITTSEMVSDIISGYIQKIQLVLINLDRLWRMRNIDLPTKMKVHCLSLEM